LLFKAQRSINITVNKAAMAITAEHIKAKIMAAKILGAAEGFLPKAFVAAYPIIPIIKDGPKVAINITRTIVKVLIT